jgi:hypothetical protein
MLASGHRIDQLKKPAATVNLAGGNATMVNCERCGQPMTLKFTTPGLTESVKVRVYECVDCQRLAFVSEPRAIAQDPSKGNS